VHGIQRVPRGLVRETVNHVPGRRLRPDAGETRAQSVVAAAGQDLRSLLGLDAAEHVEQQVRHELRRPRHAIDEVHAAAIPLQIELAIAASAVVIAVHAQDQPRQFIAVDRQQPTVACLKQ
jgi:hypothetical protein